ncbi:MAG TPA: CoA transferase [Sphingobium sp.]
MSAMALEGIRVLELSGLYGGYCGKLFADLGADVTLLEPLEGSPLRRKPPFTQDRAGPDSSLPFNYFAANKKSVVADLTDRSGLDLLWTLAGKSDLLILSDHPDAAQVDLGALRDAFPKLVCTRITPFGATGPFAGFAADDLTLMAMGGLLTMAGFPDSPPVVAYGEQGLLAGDQFAAVASIAAILHAEKTGVGEWVDVSIQEAIVMALENAAQTYQLEGNVRNRTAQSRRAGSGIFPCKDGEIYLLAGGIGETAMWGNFARWMEAQNVPGSEIFADPDWKDTDPGAEASFEAVFRPFAMRSTKAELYEGGNTWGVPMAPMSTPVDLLNNKQLAFRSYFVPVPDGNPAAGIEMPGAPYKMSQTPWTMRRAAPTLASATDAGLSQAKEAADDK